MDSRLRGRGRERVGKVRRSETGREEGRERGEREGEEEGGEGEGKVEICTAGCLFRIRISTLRS